MISDLLSISGDTAAGGLLQKSLIIRGGTEFKRTVSQFVGASVLLIGVRAYF